MHLYIHIANVQILRVPILKPHRNAIMSRQQRSKVGILFLGYVDEGVPSTAYEASSHDDDESSGDKRLHTFDFGRLSGNSRSLRENI